MDKETKELMEMLITMKAEDKAEELGVKFKVVYKVRESCPVFHIRIKKDLGEVGKFADYIGDLIVSKYGREVQFTYPSKL